METEPVNITLKNGEKWEEAVGFSSDRARDWQKVEFLLQNANNDITPKLYLLVDINNDSGNLEVPAVF